MRFFLIVLLLALVSAIGLYIYGGMIEPETQQIEQDATGASEAKDGTGDGDE